MFPYFTPAKPEEPAEVKGTVTVIVPRLAYELTRRPVPPIAQERPYVPYFCAACDVHHPDKPCPPVNEVST